MYNTTGTSELSQIYSEISVPLFFFFKCKTDISQQRCVCSSRIRTEIWDALNVFGYILAQVLFHLNKQTLEGLGGK